MPSNARRQVSGLESSRFGRQIDVVSRMRRSSVAAAVPSAWLVLVDVLRTEPHLSVSIEHREQDAQPQIDLQRCVGGPASFASLL